MDNGLQWVLMDTSYPSFNLWQLVNEKGPLYTETFKKDVNPNLRYHWDILSESKKMQYIIVCLVNGELVGEIASRLNMNYDDVELIKQDYILRINKFKKHLEVIKNI